MGRYWASIGLTLLTAAGLVIRAEAARAQVREATPREHLRPLDHESSHSQVPANPTGFRIALEANLGHPAIGGDAGRIWDVLGGLGLAQGMALTIGYDARRFGVSAALDLADPRLEDREGAGIALVALLHWRPGWSLPGGWRPRLSAGYVRQGIGSDFEEGEFPRDVTLVEPTDSEIAAGGSALTLGDGVRLTAGAERALAGTWLGWSVAASVDVLTFRQVMFRDLAYSLRETGWSVWPRLWVGLHVHI